MNLDYLDKLKQQGMKTVLWRVFVWGIVIAMITSPIFMYLV